MFSVFLSANRNTRKVWENVIMIMIMIKGDTLQIVSYEGSNLAYFLK